MSVIARLHEPRGDGYAYSRLRVAYGLTAVIWLLALQPYLSSFFGPASLCPSGGALVTALGPRTLFWAALANSVLVVVGLGVRAALLLEHVLLSALFQTPCKPFNYGDQIFIGLSFLMIFAPSRDPLSLDARLFGWRGKTFSPYLRRVLRLYTGTLYLVPVLFRLKGTLWLDGTASWVALADPTTSHVASFMARTGPRIPAWFFYLATYVAMAYEATFPVLIWVRRVRPWLVAFGLLFHAGLALVLNLGPFTIQMAVLLIGCLDDQWWPSRGIAEASTDSASAAG